LVRTDVYDLQNEEHDVKTRSSVFEDKGLALKWSASQAAQAIYDMKLTYEGANELAALTHDLDKPRGDEEEGEGEEEKEYVEPEFLMPKLDTYESFCASSQAEQPDNFAEITLLPTQAPFEAEVVPVKKVWRSMRKALKARETISKRLPDMLLEARSSRKRKRED
jgi:hypothetical protein